jgi:hypothetical protein
MWALISQIGRVSKTLVWDREAAIGGNGRVTTPAVAIAGTLATQIKLAPPRDNRRHNGYVESFNNRLRKECLNRNHWTNLREARVVIGDFKHDHNHRHRHSALGYLTRPSTLRRAGTAITL